MAVAEKRKMAWLKIGNGKIDVFEGALVRPIDAAKLVSVFALVRKRGRARFQLGPQIFGQIVRDAHGRMAFFKENALHAIASACEDLDRKTEEKRSGRHAFTHTYGIVEILFKSTQGCRCRRFMDVHVKLVNSSIDTGD